MGHFFSQPDRPVPTSARPNTVTPPSHPVPTSDHAHQTTSDPPAVADSARTEPHPPTQPPSSSSLHPVSPSSHSLLHSTPASSPAQPSRTPQPAVFYVPRNSRQTILDFSNDSPTPESKAKHALLSDDPNNNAIAIVGMGGAGKTTILRALGRHTDVWQRFPDGVWFIELGHDAKVQRLFDQLEQIVTDAFPDFLPKFAELTANDDTHSNMMEKLVDLLSPKRFLLIFDDVWDLDPAVYKLVDITCKAVQGMDGGNCKVLTSTRNEAIGRVPTHDVSIAVSPGDVRRETCIAILCKYAGIDSTRLQLWSSGNRDALDNIIDLCAGLALALSVAGSGMQEVIGRCTDASGPNAIAQYWESLKRSSVELRVAESGSRHVGLDAAIQASLKSLERVWKGKSMRVGEMFRSFCIVDKQMCIPLSVIERVWGVEDALARVRMFSRHSLVSLDEDEGGLVRGIRLHDLVHDVCVEMAEGKEGVRGWHCQLVDRYRGSLRRSQGVAEDVEMGEAGASTESKEDEWWELKEDKYMRENVVRHLLGAGRVSAALKLLTDYRWIEKTNKDEERAPFQKVIAELELVRRHLEEEEKTEAGRRIVRDLDVVTRAMGLCMVPYCVKNREECTFQLFGRLRDIVSESGVAERTVCSIERYAERPWARCGPGVLDSGRNSLRRVLELEGRGRCMLVRGGGEEVIVGGENGHIWVLDARNGRVKTTLMDHEGCSITTVDLDHTSGLMYSCDFTGQVTIWKDEKKLRSMQAEVEDEEEWIECMQVLPSSKKVVLGTTKGRLLVMDATSANLLRAAPAHGDIVSSLAIGGSEDVMVSGSQDGTIRVWDPASFEHNGTVFEGHTDWVTSLALSADGRLLASGSEDGSVRLWDVQSGEQLWSSPDGHHSWVKCVLLSGDGSLLYSAGPGQTSVWRVSNDGRAVTLVLTLPNPSPEGAESLRPGSDSQLFTLGRNRVQVFNSRQIVSRAQPNAEFLPNVETFGVSEDGATMLTFDVRSKSMDIRNVCDVSERLDRCVAKFKIAAGFWPRTLAVANSRQVVAYSCYNSCVVFVLDGRDGTVLQSFSGLEKWALSLASDERHVSSNVSTSGASSRTTRPGLVRDIGIISFSSDGEVISAFAAAKTNPLDGNPTAVYTKSMSWNVSSGESMDYVQQDLDNTATSSTATTRLVCNKEFNGWSFRFPPHVKYEHHRSPFTIATVEGYVHGAHYVANTSRLHLSTERGMVYVDLVTDNTHLPPRNAPSLPLPQRNPLASQGTITYPKVDEVYDVFISHADTDKFTIALRLYKLLVALGFKVFLDRAELRPGENAPEKMIKAMRRAKIAVVILSPEYAARKWTLKELMCFFERFRASGEREIIIIPVFYRLTLNDCRDENSLFGIVNDDGENVFVAEGFLKWMSKQQELTVEEVLKGLQSLRGVTGIENEAKVTNRVEDKSAQMKFAAKIQDAVVEAMDRYESKQATGPCRAQG